MRDAVTEKLPASRASAGNQPTVSKFRRGKPERPGATPGSVKIPFNYGADHSGRDPGSLGDRGLSDGQRAAETSRGNRVELRGSRARLDATRAMVGAATAIRHVRSSGRRASPCLHQQGSAHPSRGASPRTQTQAPADRSARRAPSRLCHRSRHPAPRPGRIPALDPVRGCRLVSSCADRRRAGGSGRGRMVGRSKPFLLLRSRRGAGAASSDSGCAREGRKDSACAGAKTDREVAPSAPTTAKVASPAAGANRARDPSRAAQQANAAAKDVTTTNSIAAGSSQERAKILPRPAPAPETRPTTIEGWTIREVVGGTAVLEGPGGVWRAAQGDTVPGIGRIESVVRWGSRWIVATSKGLISTQN